MPRASLRSLATWSVRLLVVVAVYQVVNAVAIWGTEAGRAFMFDMDPSPTLSTQEVLFTLLGLVGSVPSIALVVVFLVWTYRCHVQLVGIGRGATLRYSPGMAVGCWFIPVANLWMPLRAVRGLYRASSPDRGRPEDPPGYITAWWVLFLVVPFLAWIGIFVYVIAALSDPASGPPEPPAAMALLGVSSLVAAILAIRFVRELTDRVDRLADEAGLR